MIKLNIDISALTELAAILAAVGPSMETAAEKLTRNTYDYITELAEQRLNSRRKLYIENLHWEEEETTEPDASCYIIILNAKARWIDDGLKNFSMIPGFLNKKSGSDVKTNPKTGNRYRIIPFHYEAGPASTPEAQQDIIKTVKKAMKKQGIPGASTIERDANGNVKEGLLHSINMSGREPNRTGIGPWQGSGPMGAPIQGFSPGASSGVGKTGTPIVKGIKVYQRTDKKTGKTRRDVVSFRAASESHSADGGRWEHPGLLPENLMDEGLEWALNEFETVIFPDVMGKLTGSIIS